MALRKEDPTSNVYRSQLGNNAGSLVNGLPGREARPSRGRRRAMGSAVQDLEPHKLDNELRFGNIKFVDFLTSLEDKCPEIGEKKDRIIDAGEELVASHNVLPGFFAAPDNAIGLLFAASLHNEALDTAGKSAKRTERETSLASNFARTLFGQYSETHPLEGVKKASGLEPKERVKLFQKYQNRELSERLHTWLTTSDEMKKTREELQIADGEESHFETMVLSIGYPTHTERFGKSSTASPGIEEYVKNLYARGRAFMAEQRSSPDDILPRAWVSIIDGKNYLCMPEPLARIILEPETMGYEDEGDEKSIILSLIQHEFAHTQGNIQPVDTVDTSKESYFGLIIEEWRAEVVSGYSKELSYSDIYDAVRDVEKFHGISINELMVSLPEGGANDKAEFYAMLAGQLGLVNTAMLTGLLPDKYADLQSPKSSRDIHQTLSSGGFRNEFILRMSDEEVESCLDRQREGGVSEDKMTKLRELITKVKSDLG